ncbi:MAG: polyphosphate kinase 1 [Lautropia sp.]
MNARKREPDEGRGGARGVRRREKAHAVADRRRHHPVTGVAQHAAMDANTVVRPPALLNRELGILAFQSRVLALAEDPRTPLLERLRYLTIVSQNIDEFFEIRVAELKELSRVESAASIGASDQIDAIATRMRTMLERQYALLNGELIPAMRTEGIVIHFLADWNDAQRAWAEDIFRREVEPLLTPIALDPAHPFPRISNKILNWVVELDGRDAFGRRPGLAIVQAPRALARVMRVPQAVSGAPHGVMLLTSVVQGCADLLFPGLEVRSIAQFRLTRNSELFVDEEEVTNLRTALRTELGQRHFGAGVRLEVSAGASDKVVDHLLREFDLERRDCYFVDGAVNLGRLSQIVDLVDRPELKHPRFVPGLPAVFRKKDLFQAIARQDVLLHHPYDAFDPVMDFLRSAASDPQVVSIRQTIYRTGADSALMESLIDAARAGKEVTVVLELMARFDEEANINWAARLEEVGAHVVYGVVGHKTHAKMAMVIRREDGELKRYVHLGTGNYHPRTARVYEDFGFFTADPQICADVQEVFRRLTGLGHAGKLGALLQAPFTLHPYLLEAIARETAIAKAGGRALIRAKLNALLEPAIIAALYEASQAGVKVELIVRGVCALRPGIAGVSENIRVISVLGRFLEHSRVYYFHAGGSEEVWLASADWMSRNFFRRVELAFPVRDRALRRRVIEEALDVHLDPARVVWEMDENGDYRLTRPEGGDGGDGSERDAAADPQRVLLDRLVESVMIGVDPPTD